MEEKGARARGACSFRERLGIGRTCSAPRLEQRLIFIEHRFDAVPTEIAARRDALYWQRRVRDASRGADEDPDSLYDALRATLQASPRRTWTALDVLSASGTGSRL